MDPVYAGTIAGLVLLFGCFLGSLGVYAWCECRTRQQITDTQYQEAP